MAAVFAILFVIGYFICLGLAIARSDSRQKIPMIALLVLIPYSCAAVFAIIVNYATGSLGAALFVCSAVAACVYILSRIFTMTRSRSINGGVLFLLLAYLAVVLFLTILNREPGTIRVVQMKIGHFITAYRRSGDSRFTILHAMENIALFVPLGVLYPLVDRNRRAGLLSTLGCGITLSFFIELLQLQLHCGQCDIDDIIMNSLGAVVGWILCRVMALFLEED